jgi:hypothetical protein
MPHTSREAKEMQVQFVRSGRERRLLTRAQTRAEQGGAPHMGGIRKHGFHKRIEHAGT